MGETAVRKQDKKVKEMKAVQRVTLSRDHKLMNKTSDLGIGVKVAGGVRCDKCGGVHTVITDVQGDLAPQLAKGHAVMEWCGRDIDGASYEEVRKVLLNTEKENTVEIVVKECSGPPPPEAGTEGLAVPTETTDTPLQDTVISTKTAPFSDKEESHTPKSLSPSVSPVHSRPPTPTPSATSTPSPTPPPSPTLRRGSPRPSTSDPRPASINLPALRPQGDVVKPKFMINDVPTSPTSVEAPVSKYTIESFAPKASIHLSLRYRAVDGHLRLLLHEVKHEGKSSTHRSYFINSYLLPDEDKQGVRSCEVLSDVSDLENPQFYLLSQNQLETAALRVSLWEAKGKHHNFIGEVLLSLADNDVVKLQGLPSWFPVCNIDPNLPPLPAAVLSKKPKREDIFHRVRRGTGYALQTLRRPRSAAIDTLGLEGSPLSSSGSIENLAKKLQGGGVTMPRRTRKDRRPLSSGLYLPTSTTKDTESTTTAKEIGNGNVDSPHANKLEDNDAVSRSVPSSPLLLHKDRKDNGPKKRFPAIFQALRGSLLPSQSFDPAYLRQAASEDTSRHLSLSADGRHQVRASPLSTSSTPSAKPQQVTPQDASRGSRSTQPQQDEATPNKKETRYSNRETTPSHSRILDGSWYSTEEDPDSKKLSKRSKKKKFKITDTMTFRRLSGHSNTSGLKNGEKIGIATKKKSRSADDLLDGGLDEQTSPVPAYTHYSPHLSQDSCSSSASGNTADSRAMSVDSSSDDPGEQSLDGTTRSKMPKRSKVITSSPKLIPIAPVEHNDTDGVAHSAPDTASPLTRWRSLDDLLEALPLKKLKPRWRHRNRTHRISPGRKQPSHSPPLLRRSSEPAFDGGKAIGGVKLEVTFNPDTSMIGIRLHEHTLSAAKTDLMVQTYLFSRGGVASEEGQRMVTSFKKTHYSHTIVATFHCNSKLQDMSLQVSLETSGRFFNRRNGHIILDLGSLLLPSSSFSCDQWFPLFPSPTYPPDTQHN